ASVEVRSLRGAQGPRRALGPGRTRLCLEQGGLEIADLDRMAGPPRRFDRPGGGCVLLHAAGRGGAGVSGVWAVILRFNIKQSDLDGRTERAAVADARCGDIRRMGPWPLAARLPADIAAATVRGRGTFVHAIVAALLRPVVRGGNDHIRRRGRGGGRLAVALLPIATGLLP